MHKLEKIISDLDDLFGLHNSSFKIPEDAWVREHEKRDHETLDGMVRVLAKNSIDLLRRERYEWGVKEEALKRNLRTARSSEAQARRWADALEHVIRKHVNSGSILEEAEQIYLGDMFREDDDLPF
jgi:hypothetical protein